MLHPVLSSPIQVEIQVERALSDPEVSDSSIGPQNRTSKANSKLHNHTPAHTLEKGTSRRGNNWNESDSLLLVQVVAHIQEHPISNLPSMFNNYSGRK